MTNHSAFKELSDKITVMIKSKFLKVIFNLITTPAKALLMLI